MDPPICWTARIFLSHISLKSYQCDLILIKQCRGPYAVNLILKAFTFDRRSGGLYPPPRNPYGLHWTPLDSSGFQCPFCQAKLAGTKPSPLESSPVQSSPVHWTESPVKVQWSPQESTGFHWIIAHSTDCY